MKNRWNWNSDYFKNEVFRKVENLPFEFNVEDFIKQFNKIPTPLRTSNDPNFIQNHVIELYPNYHYDFKLVSKFLHDLVSKNILKVKYVSNDGRTQSIFSK